MCDEFYPRQPLRLTWNAVLRTMATMANPKKAIAAINKSAVVKLNQVGMVGWFAG